MRVRLPSAFCPSAALRIRDPQVGQRQAELYADCLQKQFARRPVILYSNGYEHWLWDDAHYPPRSVQGFLKKPELELLMQRRTTRKKLAEAKIDEAIVERYYQTRASDESVRPSNGTTNARRSWSWPPRLQDLR
jgi:type I site-specific restriction endonuclease